MAEYRKNLPITERPAWMTIATGQYKMVSDLRQGVLGAACEISDVGNDMLYRITPIQEVEEYELLCISVRDLGFTKSATRRQIYEKAATFGLIPCPQETGALVRIKYTDQPMDEWILIASEPIQGFSSLRVFYVGCESGVRRLGGYSGGLGCNWELNHLWVFARQKKPTEPGG